MRHLGYPRCDDFLVVLSPSRLALNRLHPLFSEPLFGLEIHSVKIIFFSGLMLALGAVCGAAQTVTHLDASAHKRLPDTTQQATPPDAALPDGPKIMKPPELSYAQ